MGLLARNLAEVKEKSVVPDGQYTLAITGVTTSASGSSGRGKINICQKIEGHPDAKPVFTNIFVVKQDDNEIFVDNNDQLAAGFMKAFGIAEDDFFKVYDAAERAEETQEKEKHTEFNGLTCEGILKAEENEFAGEINEVTRYIVQS